MGALGEAVALDLSEPWWRRWWTSRDKSAQARVQELDRLVTHEFESIANTLLEAARLSFRSQRAAMVQRASMIFLNLVEYVQQQSEERLARVRELVAEREAQMRGHHGDRLVALVVDAGAANAPVTASVLAGEDRVGIVTSGGFGHRIGQSIALGYVAAHHVRTATLSIDIHGERRAARVVGQPLYDPRNIRMME